MKDHRNGTWIKIYIMRRHFVVCEMPRQNWWQENATNPEIISGIRCCLFQGVYKVCLSSRSQTLNRVVSTYSNLLWALRLFIVSTKTRFAYYLNLVILLDKNAMWIEARLKTNNWSWRILSGFWSVRVLSLCVDLML